MYGKQVTWGGLSLRGADIINYPHQQLVRLINTH